MIKAISRLFCFASVAYGAVVTLTEANFDSYVGGSSDALVEFYAPWCGHCKKLAPEWQIAGDTFDANDNVIIGAVDATENNNLAQKYGIKGYPTIKFFPKGSVTAEEYNGGRSADTIVSWVNDKVGTNKKIKKAPSAVMDLDQSNFDSIVLDPSKNAFVEFYAPWCGHCKELAPKYETLAGIYAGDKNVVIAKVDATENADLADRFDVQGYPTLKFFKSGSNKAPLNYEQEREVVDMVEFVNDNAGTFRLPTGGLMEGAGRLPSLDSIISAAATVDSALVDAIKAAAANEEKEEFASMYVTAATKILEKGQDFVDKEIKRLSGMVKNSNVPAEKKTNFGYRHNILEAFRK